MATRNSSVEDNGDAEALPVNLVSYKEDSSGSEKEEEEDEYIVPRKKPRLDQDKNGIECNCTITQSLRLCVCVYVYVVEDAKSRSCPYLDTIDRSVLDFDFEKLCSISLLNNNVYACLVCGRYFQGEGMHIHTYTQNMTTEHMYTYKDLKTYVHYILSG